MGRPIGTHNYYVYITTNKNKTVLYTGVTNNLLKRVSDHEADAKGPRRSFAGKYNCYHLVYYEHFQYILDAIAREKQIKSWSRSKKEALISSFNPGWKFLETDLEPMP